MYFSKLIYQYKDYILVAFLTAFITVQIYPYTVTHGWNNHDIEHSQPSGFRLPDVIHGLCDLAEEKRWLVLPDGMNTLFAVAGCHLKCTDGWCGSAFPDDNSWRAFIGNLFHPKPKTGLAGVTWPSFRRIVAGIEIRLKHTVGPILRGLKRACAPYIHRVEYFVTPGMAVDLADVTQEARMFSLMTGYDYGPYSFLPPHYTGEKEQEVGYMSQLLNWWYKTLGYNEYDTFPMARIFMLFLQVVDRPLLILFLALNIISMLQVFIVGKVARLNLNYSSQIPPFTIENEHGQTISLEFEPISVLGYGAFGKIQKVSQRGSNENFVLKTVKKIDTDRLGIPTSRSVGSLLTIGRLEQIYVEKRILALARDCPLLTHLCWAMETDVYMHFITPLHRGGDMRHFLERYECLGEEAIQFIMAEVICGLEFLHAHGIVHRDLKLDNIVIDADSHIRLIDFGLAAEKVFDSEKKLYDQCGSPLTIAPEILNNSFYNESCDWWAVGVVMFWLYTGEPPFDGSTEEEIYHRIRHEEPQWDKAAGYNIKDCILWFLEKDPDCRLGMQGCPVGGIGDQPFFGDILWELVRCKQLTPPAAMDIASLLCEIEEEEKAQSQSLEREDQPRDISAVAEEIEA